MPATYPHAPLDIRRGAFASIPTFDIQCGPEIQEGVGDHAAIWTLAKKIAEWSRAKKKFAPPITAINGSSWACEKILELYANKGKLLASLNVYFDHRWGTIDETLALDRLQRAFQYRGVTWKQICIMEWGMCLIRKGKLTLKDAYERLQMAVEGSGYPYVAQFAIMDGLVGEDSFGLLAPDYTKSVLGNAIVTV